MRSTTSVALLLVACTLFLSALSTAQAVSPAAIKSLVFTSVQRQIDVRGQVVIHIIDLTIANQGSEPVDHVIVTVPNVKQLAVFGAHETKNKNVLVKQLATTALTVEEVTSLSLAGEYTYYKVNLARALQSDKTYTMQVTMGWTHSLINEPAEAIQGQEHLVMLKDHAHLLSPYVMKNEMTSVLLPTSRVESHTTVEDKTNVRGETINYGPFHDVQPFTVTPITVHFPTNFQFARISTMTKQIEASMWGNVAVEDRVTLHNDAPRLKGSYSRVDYVRHQQMGQNHGSFRGLAAHLPFSAFDIYYRDEIGNVSTSHVRYPDYDDQPVVFEVMPRFPMMGGWMTDFYYGYSIPSRDSLFTDSNHPELFMLNVSFASPFLITVVDDLTVRVVLPEGAGNIRVEVPFPVDSQSRDVHFTFLDITGRPVVVLRKSNLISTVHNQHFQVYFTISPLTKWKEPAMVAIAILALFAATMVYVRIDLSLGGSSSSSSKASVFSSLSSAHSQFSKLLTKLVDSKSAVSDSEINALLDNFKKVTEHKEYSKVAERVFAAEQESLKSIKALVKGGKAAEAASKIQHNTEHVESLLEALA